MRVQAIVFLEMLALLLCTGCSQSPSSFDWQGHRGARGLMPENSIPAFLKALEYPVRTLELDVVVSADSQLVASHEPWMSHKICRSTMPLPPLTASNERTDWNIYRLPYSKVRSCDCGSSGNEDFPQQAKVAVFKPLLRDVVSAVRNYCDSTGIGFPEFNIEIKSRPDWDGVFTPDPVVFAGLLVRELRQLQISEQSTIQSFDPRALQAVRRLAPDIRLAYLLESVEGSLTEKMELLGFIPEILSPHHAKVSTALVEEVHALGMRIVPWTVNEQERMQALIKMGVDGIITDYPNLVP